MALANLSRAALDVMDTSSVVCGAVVTGPRLADGLRRAGAMLSSVLGRPGDSIRLTDVMYHARVYRLRERRPPAARAGDGARG
jgi:hypothetical protein